MPDGTARRHRRHARPGGPDSPPTARRHPLRPPCSRATATPFAPACRPAWGITQDCCTGLFEAHVRSPDQSRRSGPAPSSRRACPNAARPLAQEDLAGQRRRPANGKVWKPRFAIRCLTHACAMSSCWRGLQAPVSRGGMAPVRASWPATHVRASRVLRRAGRVARTARSRQSTHRLQPRRELPPPMIW